MNVSKLQQSVLYWCTVFGTPATLPSPCPRVPAFSAPKSVTMRSSVVVCVAIVVTFVVLLVSSETTVDVVPGARSNNCQRTRRPIAVRWPGCEDKATKVPICTGTCNSYDVVQPYPPYFAKVCSCCKSSKYFVKKRTLLFNCAGGMQNHTIFLPITESCDCVMCIVS